MITQALLASAIQRKDLDKLRYPVFVSRKLDGIRCLIHPENGPVARSFKPIPNNHIRKNLSNTEFHGFDGEIMLRPNDVTKNPGFHDVQSAVMSEEGIPDFTYQVFDDFTFADNPYLERYEQLAKKAELFTTMRPHFEILPQWTCNCAEDVWSTYLDFVDEGAEGIMVRSPNAPYKSGRSTVREEFLLKMKPMADTEGRIIGYEPLMSNQNEGVRNVFGQLERSSHQAGLVAQDTLGALLLDHPTFGEVRVGTGFTAAMRQWIWNNRESLRNQTVTFKYQDIGTVDKPRFPVFLKILNVQVMVK